MFAREKGKRQGFTHEDTKRTFTWIQSILSGYDQSDEIVRLARQFSEDYTEEMRSSAEPTDARISLKGFHLACAFDDHTALRIILAGTFSINERAQAPTQLHADPTPLEICAWYGEADSEFRSAKILLENDGTNGREKLQVSGGWGAAEIAARRGLLNLLKLLGRNHRETLSRRSLVLASLARLGNHNETAAWLLAQARDWVLWESDVKDPVTGQRHLLNELLTSSLLHAQPGAEASQEKYSARGRYALRMTAEPSRMLPWKTLDDLYELLRFAQNDPAELFERRGISVNDADSDGHTLLSQAIRYNYRYDHGTGGTLRAVKNLLDAGAEVELADVSGRTALSYAASSFGDEAILKVLMDSGARIDSRDIRGRTPLHWTCSYFQSDKQLRGIDFLLQLDPRPDLPDGSDRTPLSYAAEYGGNDLVRLLLNAGANATARNKSGWTPLYYALSRYKYHHSNSPDCTDIIHTLLKADPRSDLKDNKGRTLLSIAAGNGFKKPVEILLAAGARANSRDQNGRSPLSWAASFYGNTPDVTQLMELLLGADPQPHNADYNGRTPLSWAAEVGYENSVRIFLERGALAETTDKDGRTPLSRAASGRYKDSLFYLLGHADVNVNSRDNNGHTPLYWAVTQTEDSSSRVSSLLQCGADPSILDNEGLTPLQYALKNINENWGIATLLYIAPVNGRIGAQNLPEWALWRDEDCDRLLSSIIFRRWDRVMKMLLNYWCSTAHRHHFEQLRSSNFTRYAKLAVHTGNFKILKMVLEGDGSIPAPPARQLNTMLDGLTPLHLAARLGHKEMVRELLGKGADSSIRSQEKKTSTEIATANGHEEVAQLLRDHERRLRVPYRRRFLPDLPRLEETTRR
jgi:ankyrin repeat protein